MIQHIHKDHRLAGQGAIFICAILWSTSGLFIRLIDWHPMAIAGSRSLIAALFLFCLRSFAPRRQRNIAFKDIPLLAICGIGYTASMILFVIANKHTASANAILLHYTAPAWAAFLAWLFLKERPRWEQWCALALVSMGMFFVFSSGLAAGSFMGDMFALVSGVTFGANSVVLRGQKDGSPADILLFSHLMCAFFSIPFFLLYPPEFTAGNIASICFLGFFQLGLASALYAYGIKRIPVIQAMLTSSIEPVVNPVWVLLFIGEKPTISVIAGGVIIIGAVLFSSILSSLRRRN